MNPTDHARWGMVPDQVDIASGGRPRGPESGSRGWNGPIGGRLRRMRLRRSEARPEPDLEVEVIDLRERQAAVRDDVAKDEVFEMPAWARGEEVFKSSRE